MMGQCTLSKLADDTKLGGVASGLCCQSEEPQQTREMDQQEPHEVQQGELLSPALEEEESQPFSWKAALPRRPWGLCWFWLG